MQPSQGSDPGGFQAGFTAILNMSLPDNPFQEVHNLFLQVYRSGLRGTVANMSWDITGYNPVP